jgi:hypothetical protein
LLEEEEMLIFQISSHHVMSKSASFTAFLEHHSSSLNGINHNNRDPCSNLICTEKNRQAKTTAQQS